jgi:rhomboid protease GluP
MNDPSKTPLLVTVDLDLAEEWKLVLLSQGLTPSLHWSDGGLVLSVPTAELERARAGLSLYQRENTVKLAPPDIPVEAPGALAGSAAAGLLIPFFFSVTVKWLPDLPWFERGSADAQRILGGELWRTVTALTLHADVAHAVSNGFAAALFFGGVFSILGPGLGFALALAAGITGNLANALIRAGLISRWAPRRWCSAPWVCWAA